MNPLEQFRIDEAALNQIVAANPEVEKSLAAGGLTNLSDATGGTALTVPSLDNELKLAITNDQNELMALKHLRQDVVGNLAHTYPVQAQTGDSELGSAFRPETQLSEPNVISPWRNTRTLKFAQNVAQTFMSAVLSDSVRTPGAGENLHAHNMLSAVLQLLTNIEWAGWQGDSDVCALQPDSIFKQIEDFNTQRLPLNGERPVYDAQGARLVELVGSDYKLKIIEEAALIAYKNGAAPTGLVYPAALAKQMQDYIQEKLRFMPQDGVAVPLTAAAQSYPTAYGFQLGLAKGKSLAGPARFLQVKGEVVESKDTASRPKAPTFTSATAANAASGKVSKFLSSDAGAYKYDIYPISEYGEIGPRATGGSKTATVAAGQQVTLVMSPASNPSATTAGFLIARSSKDGSVLKEMIRIKAEASGTTTFVDLNEERPGTARALLVSPDYARNLFLGLNPAGGMPTASQVDKSQLAKVINLELGRMNASLRNLVCAFTSPDITVPYKHVLIKNIAVD
ncbi:MAG: hypothetical protein AAF975_00620 [Spirochaetota bacterium]